MTDQQRLAKLYGYVLPLHLLTTERTYWLARVKQIDKSFTVRDFIEWWGGLKK